jgi:hypothetical protein
MEYQMNMTTHKPTSSDQFFDALTNELIAMPDEQVLDGANAMAIQARGLERLKNAKAEAGRRRLAAANVRAEAARSQKVPGFVVQVPIEDARKYLANAANDTRYTLAARNLNEMSDEDVLRLYAQLKHLESQSDSQRETDT